MFKIVVIALCISVLGGCAGVYQGRPYKPKYQDPIVRSLVEKYSKPNAIFANNTSMTVKERNQVLDELIYLTDVNYHNFEAELFGGRASFDTSTDLAILGLGAAGGLVTHSATQAIISAISGGIGGARVSINKNYFHDSSTQALIAKMQSSRKAKLALIREAMTLDTKDYSLPRGLSDIADYYNAGTIIGALQDIVADAGHEKKKADEELKVVLEIARGKTFLDKNSTTRVDMILKKIPSLSDGDAIALNQAPPVQDPKVEKVVQEKDKKNQRFVNGAAARHALLLRAQLDERSDENLSAWEKALKQQ